MRLMSKNRWTRVAQAGVVLGLGMSAPLAHAQLAPGISGRPGEEHITSGVGVSLSGGGGVTGFTGSNEGGLTDVGGSWEVRGVLGTRTIAALEAAYLGSARHVGGGVAPGVGLVGNGAEGAFRLNAPFLSNATLVEPFAFLGLGWSHYTLTGVGDHVVASRADSIGTVPMGIGLAVGYRGFIAEARLTYRPAFDDNHLVLAEDGRAFNLDSWNAGLMVGFEF